MLDFKTEIITAILGVIGMIATWKLGGKQSVKNQTTDSITAGTDKIVDTSNKLIDRIELMLQQEEIRTATEREHRETCEAKLKRVENDMKVLRKSFNDLESRFQMTTIAHEAKNKKKSSKIA